MCSALVQSFAVFVIMICVARIRNRVLLISQQASLGIVTAVSAMFSVGWYCLKSRPPGLHRSLASTTLLMFIIQFEWRKRNIKPISRTRYLGIVGFCTEPPFINHWRLDNNVEMDLSLPMFRVNYLYNFQRYNENQSSE